MEGTLSLRCALLVYLVDHCLDLAGPDVTAELCLYASRMHGRGAYATLPMPTVEGNGEEDVCCLRSSVSNEGRVRCPLKVGIIEIDVGEAVARGG